MLGRIAMQGLRRAGQLAPTTTTRLASTITQRTITNTLFKPTSCTHQLTQRHNYSADAPKWTDEELQAIVDKYKLVLFMKGTPDAPQCGFSKNTCAILSMHGCKEFAVLNVLSDEVLRERIKEFSNWPTIPQVYMGGEFVGGFDIMLQLHQSGELIEELEKIGHRSALIDKDAGSDS